MGYARENAIPLSTSVQFIVSLFILPYGIKCELTTYVLKMTLKLRKVPENAITVCLGEHNG